jgi:hypothetical protein
MTVDLSELKEGDTVKFRCKGEAVVQRISRDIEIYSLKFKGYDGIDKSYLIRSPEHDIDV